MATNNKWIDKRLDELDIVRAIEDKDVPYVIVQFRGLINQAIEDERQRCIEELDKLDGTTEDESLWFMEHVLERIEEREETRAEGHKGLPQREMIWEGIKYFKEQAIVKLSRRD